MSSPSRSSSEGVDLRILLGENISSSEDDRFSYDGVDTSEEEEKGMDSDASTEGDSCRSPFPCYFDGGTDEDSSNSSGNSSSLPVTIGEEEEEEEFPDPASDVVPGGDFTRFGGCGSRRTTVDRRTPVGSGDDGGRDEGVNRDGDDGDGGRGEHGGSDEGGDNSSSAGSSAGSNSPPSTACSTNAIAPSSKRRRLAP